jgi:hypothetical protein
VNVEEEYLEEPADEQDGPPPATRAGTGRSAPTVVAG